MTHFVSASCGNQRCACGGQVTHKLGEEIPHDEPCMTCGDHWTHGFLEDVEANIKTALTRLVTADQRRDVLARVTVDMQDNPEPDRCSAMYHFTGPAGQRHNLTAYVCCACFTRILGPATGCPLEEKT